MGLIDASLINKVLDKTANRIIGQSCNDRGLHAKAAMEAASYVVLAASFPNPEGPRSGYAAIVGIEAKHDFAETYQIPSAF